MSILHTIDRRIYYEHTDSAGVVYYSRYLYFLEQARTEALRDYGFDHQNLLEQYDLIFVVKKIEVDYLKAVRLDEIIEIQSKITHFSLASLSFEQKVWNVSKNEYSLNALVKIACLNSQFKPIKLPKMLKIALSKN